MNAPVNLAALRSQPAAAQPVAQREEDYTIDFFSVRGFKLAYKLAEVFSASDAVPAMFRQHNLKRSGYGENAQETWVENPSAIGNCLVAIETARAVGMSITAVMQHANIIEGKLSWSAQFVIAAINASGRFTPLRFDIKSRGKAVVAYKEKGRWNQQARRYDMVDKTIEVEDLVCVAWAYTLENGKPTKERIESPPVSIRMAVEEGWYTKPGSKWQTEMKHLMLQYRAGAFFGRLHAPDVVMGMGHTAEERMDMTTVDVAPDGTVTGVRLDEISRPTGAPPPPPADEVHEEHLHGDDQGNDAGAPAADAPADSPAPAFDFEALATRMRSCKDLDTLDLMADDLRDIPDSADKAAAMDVYKARRQQLTDPPPAPAPAARTSRTAGARGGAVE